MSALVGSLVGLFAFGMLGAVVRLMYAAASRAVPTYTLDDYRAKSPSRSSTRPAQFCRWCEVADCADDTHAFLAGQLVVPEPEAEPADVSDLPAQWYVPKLADPECPSCFGLGTLPHVSGKPPEPCPCTDGRLPEARRRKRATWLAGKRRSHGIIEVPQSFTAADIKRLSDQWNGEIVVRPDPTRRTR